MFQTRHLNAVAAVLRAEIHKVKHLDPDYAHRVDSIATGLADLFQENNPRFNRRRFFRAAECQDLHEYDGVIPIERISA